MEDESWAKRVEFDRQQGWRMTAGWRGEFDRQQGLKMTAGWGGVDSG